MRPRTLDEYVGQPHVTRAERAAPHRDRAGRDRVTRLWGPPGTGKTTLGHLIARAAGRAFEPFSAVSEGVPRLREIFDLARGPARARAAPARCSSWTRSTGSTRRSRTAFLPAVEDGTVTLIGATTENPSFELNAALLSRARVIVLEPLAAGGHRDAAPARARDDRELGLGGDGTHGR